MQMYRIILNRAINEKFPNGLPSGVDIIIENDYAYFTAEGVEYKVSFLDGYVTEKRLEQAVVDIKKVPELVLIDKSDEIVAETKDKTTLDLVDEIDSIIETASNPVSTKKVKKSDSPF